ncbi:hypothetical protein EYF80_016546 [Liparis tanakae]|uniref:Uncharacterized protein n=1 Tax=Liparis tanakae TaxID=230148 RepID=A0A4Z2I6Y2_9TELE|nr:hypothetical protein EYF80_016546 [Liparis tanakae]
MDIVLLMHVSLPDELNSVHICVGKGIISSLSVQPTVQASTLPWVVAFVWSSLISGGLTGCPEGTGIVAVLQDASLHKGVSDFSITRAEESEEEEEEELPMRQGYRLS